MLDTLPTRLAYEVELYYDVRGTGRPLIVLHGGLGAHDMFGPILDQLAAGSGGEMNSV